MNGDAPIPTLLAFLLCDSVIHDAETQKKTLVGLFDKVLSVSAPFPANISLYAKLVEGSGQYTIKVRMVNLKDEAPVLELSASADWRVPENPLEFATNLRGIPVPDFGAYEFQMFANDIYLGRALFKAEKMQLPSLPPKGQ